MSRRPSIRTRALFALLTLIAFFAVLELLLWAGGVRPLIAERDPFQGFSASVRAFELDESAGLYRTPPRATRHSFNYQEFAARKPADGFRVFVLGGSSAYGFPWGASRAFPRLLEDALRQAAPRRGIEVINAAAMSYGSHRLRILAGELLRYEPDLLVIYSGHNEFIETRFYSEQIGRAEQLDRLRGLLHRWRFYAWVASLRERLARPAEPAEHAEDAEGDNAALLGLDVVREYPREVLKEQRGEAEARFEENLRAIVTMAREVGVPVWLCTVPSNLAGWAPNHSTFAAEVGSDERRRVEQALLEAAAALERDDPSTAADTLRRAVDLAPGHAELLFRLGVALSALGRQDAAREALRAARDTDAQPSRAPAFINEAIRRVGAAPGASWIDVEAAFTEHAEHGIPGFDLFEDYVHPKPNGHRIIAQQLWKRLLADGPTGPLNATTLSFDAALAAAESERPADVEAPNPALLFNLAVVLENQGRDEEAIERYRECLALQPSYYVARANLARLLARRGRHGEAATEHRRVLETEPGYLRSLLGLAEALRRSGDADAAREVASRAVQRDSASAAAQRVLGLALFQLQRFDRAEQAFRAALALDPGDAASRVDLGYCLLHQMKLDEAAASFRAAEPGDGRARNGLGAVLTERGEWAEAERLFRESLRIDPADPFARVGLEEIARRRGEG